MRISVVCNCGLVLMHPDGTLLLDAVNEPDCGYSSLSEAEYARMLAGEGAYGSICGLLFSHAHSDHYDAARAGALARASGAPVFVPDGNTPDVLYMQYGPFSVEFHRFAHIPVAQQTPCDHGVFLISDGEQTVYTAADAAPQMELHRQVFAGRRADCAFWSVPYLLYPQTRAGMAGLSEKNYVYHVPPEPDLRGVRRKCMRLMERCRAELPSVTLITHSPAALI